MNKILKIRKSGMNKSEHKNQHDKQTVPFEDATEAWFWFIKAQEARNDGARYTAGMSLLPRPCEPSDFLKILDRLYRNRILLRDHFLVLRHYGRRQLAPDNRRVKESIAFKLWNEAFEKIEPILIKKNIVQKKSATIFYPAEFKNNENYKNEAFR